MKKNDDLKKAKEAIGCLTEMGLMSLRAALAAGSTLQEATIVVSAFLTAQIDSSRHTSQEQEENNEK